MKDFFKTALLFIIPTLIIIIVGINFLNYNQNKLNKEAETTANNSTAETRTPDEIKEDDIEQYGEDLRLTHYQTILEDTNGDNNFDPSSDTELSLYQATEEYHLSFDFEIFDSNNDEAIDEGETTHVKFMIINDSDSDYEISDVNLYGDSNFFTNDDDFKNMTSTNTGDNSYSFSENELTTSTNGDFTLKSNEIATFEFDVTWSNIPSTGVFSNNLLHFDFTANTTDKNPVHFELNEQEYNFSL